MDSPRLARARVAALDFETTGVSRGDHRVVEIGIVEVTALEITGRYEALVNPGLPIHPGAAAVHGITDQDVGDAPRFAALAAEVHGRLSAADAIVCHNAPFDMPFLQREMKAAGLPLVDRPVIDTLAAARAAWGRGENSLGEVAGRLGVRGGHAHRAAADAEMTARVLMAFAAHFGEEFPLAGFPGYLPDGSVYYRGDAFRTVRGGVAAGHHARSAGARAAVTDPAPPIADPGARDPREAARMAQAAAAYAAPAAQPPAGGLEPQNQTVMKILLNSAARSGRQVTVLCRVTPREPPRPYRVSALRVEGSALVVARPGRGEEALIPLDSIVEVRW